MIILTESHRDHVLDGLGEDEKEKNLWVYDFDI